MSVRRDQDGYHVFRCDECGDEEGGISQDFMTSVTYIQEQGWSYDRQTRSHNCGCLQEIPPEDIYGDFR